ncbi:MAG: Gfo/Idh/MocA family protein [Vulcanimicrobiaceae bacterium]
MNVIRVGVVGSSFGATVHIPAYRAQGRFEVVALASPRRAGDIARERRIPQSFTSVEAMLDGVELDVVSIAAPPFAHKVAVLASLARGKHVLCEKPFGLNVAEAEDMLAAAERAGTVCALAHEFRYLSSNLALRELVANAHLGPLRALEVAFMTTFLRADSTRSRSWWFERVRGGGLTGAYFSHVVDLASWLAGRAPLEARGFERTANPERRDEQGDFTSDVADGAFAQIDYGEGLIATLAADATRAVESALVAVHGEARTAVASGKSVVESTTFVVDADETSELELAPQPHANLAAAHPNLPAFTTLLDEFANALEGKPAMLPTFADGLATQRVLAAVGYSVTED